MKKLVVGGFILLSILMTGCTRNNDEKSSTGVGTSQREKREKRSKAEGTEEETVYRTENGTFTLKLSDGWEALEPDELSDDADLSFENYDADIYYMVLSEHKDDFEGFEEYKDLIVPDMLEDTYDVEESDIEYNGFKGTRYTFGLTSDGIKTAWIYDVLEGETYYIQNIGWTINSKKEKNKKNLTQLMESLTFVK
ncbi:hypothetical protein ACYSNR_01215 [Enterococcus sp. LJL128]